LLYDPEQSLPISQEEREQCLGVLEAHRLEAASLATKGKSMEGGIYY